MKPAGKKQKGARLERRFAKMLRDKGLDKKAQRMPLSGAFPHLPADIYINLGIHPECKAHERLRIWEWWDELGPKVKLGKEPVLIFSSNFRPIMACIKADYLLNLLLIEKQYLEDIDGQRK